MNNCFIQRMRDMEIKNLSDKELHRVFEGCLIPKYCIDKMKKLMDEGLTIEQVWNTPESLFSIVQKISEIKEQHDKLYSQEHNLKAQAIKQFGMLAFAKANEEYKKLLKEAEEFENDPAWNNIGRGEI